MSAENPELPSQPPVGEAQTAAQLGSLLNATQLDALMMSPREFMGLDPAADTGEQPAQILELQAQALTEIVVPQTLATMMEHSLHSTTGEVMSALRSVDDRLQTVDTNLQAVDGIIRGISTELTYAKSAIQMLENMVNEGQVSAGELRAGRQRLKMLEEVYSDGKGVIIGLYEAASEDVRSAAKTADHGTGAAEVGRQHFVEGRQKLVDNPQLAYSEDSGPAVEKHGDATAAEHRQARDREVATGIDRIADMRDDTYAISRNLSYIAHELPGIKAAESLPGIGQFQDAVQRLGVLAYKVENGEDTRGLLRSLTLDLAGALEPIERKVRQLSIARAGSDQMPGESKLLQEASARTQNLMRQLQAA